MAIRLLCTLFLFFGLAGCAGAGDQTRTDTVITRNGRSFGLHATPPENGDFGQAFARIKAVGASVETLSLNWTDIESTPGKLDNAYLSVANQFYPAQKTRLLLVLRPINTNHKDVPGDIATRTFDDPVVIARFERLLDYVFAQTPDVDFTALAIGNEVDAYLNGDIAKQAQYKTFYEAVVAYVRSKRPGLRVGISIQLGGLTGAEKAVYQKLNQKSDVILVSYYPLKSDFTVREPVAPLRDIQSVVDTYSGKKLLFTEVGYPSSGLCNSSEEKQATFVRNVFRVWDKNPTAIESIVFSWLADISPASVAMFQKYYGSSAPAFGEYLRTIGFVNYEGAGKEKAAFAALREEAKRRGW